ncbi:MAG TPA: hypothetical protein DEA96_14820 [Leptospiraceae bacterium]|nr:hypothetical protein [Spirochaetaceae bacterium]HBS06239.1 hypothetical protein [Leptospiraceae bacterium]|tara:strand:- start:44484 stop:45341 length:858 start_codon:yes stop_codon:yes gene_type:complete
MAILAALFPISFIASEELPEHVSYGSLCCLMETLKSDGVPFTFESGQIQQLDDNTISRWEGRTFLYMRSNNPNRLFTMKIESARKWLKERTNQDRTIVEFQRLTLGKKSFLLTLYSTSPVTRTTALWTAEAEFQFSTHGDLLAVDPPAWNRKSYRLYFWNPTGSDLSIVDFNASTGTFSPVLAVFDSSGTFSDGSGDDPFIPVMRQSFQSDERIRLFDHFSKFKAEKGYLKQGSEYWELASRDQFKLIAFKPSKEYSDDSESRYQPDHFFKDCLYTTAWIESESD